MMLSGIKKLISISSESICQNCNPRPSEISGFSGRRLDELNDLLRMKNGFYAFESALHVFPTECYPQAIDIEFWNYSNNWKDKYDALLNQILFFAEDVFGEQFGISGDQIIRFIPETGETVPFSGSLEEWAAKILDDFAFETGYDLATKWQKLNGLIPFGTRLLPVRPFFLGGKFEIDNLYAVEAFEGMKFRADIWRQTKDLPDGSEIELRIVE